MRQRQEIQEVLRQGKHRLIGAAILVFWLVTMGFLLEREVLRPARAPVLPQERLLRPYDLWLGVFAGPAHQAGYIHLRSVPEPRGERRGAQLYFDARINLTLLGQQTDVTLLGGAWVAEDAGLAEFDLRMGSMDHLLRVEGAADGGVLRGTLHTAGEAIPFRLPIGRALSLGGGMTLPALNLPLLEPGEERYIETFDPFSMSVTRGRLKCLRKETIEVLGEPTETWVIETTIAGSTATAWVTAEEEVVRAETPWGFSLRRIVPQDAGVPAVEAAADEPSLLEMAAVQPEGLRPFRGARRMALRVAGIAPELLPASGSVQRMEEGRIIVAPEESAPRALSSEERAAALASDPFVQSDHPRIREAALAAAGDGEDDAARADLLHDWMYETLEKEAVVSIPSALDVLRTKQGDCNEHTVLYVALARSLGIPARIAIGLVWSDDLEGFYYHAWPEVYLDRWVWIDPTLGQRRADAARLKLFDGGIERWTQLLPYIGQIAIEVLEVE